MIYFGKKGRDLSVPVTAVWKNVHINCFKTEEDVVAWESCYNLLCLNDPVTIQIS